MAVSGVSLSSNVSVQSSRPASSPLNANPSSTTPPTSGGKQTQAAQGRHHGHHGGSHGMGHGGANASSNPAGSAPGSLFDVTA
jgi:hypothetical protein